MGTFLRRLVQAATLDPKLYEECVDNPRLVWPALAIVLAGGAAGTLGQYPGRNVETDALLENLWRAPLVWAVSWPVLAGAAYALGRWGLGGKGSFGGLFRGLGWAFAPGMLQIAVGLRALSFMAFAVPMVWIVAAGMAATARTLRISSSRAMVAMLAAWAVWLVVQLLVYLVLGMLPSFTI